VTVRFLADENIDVHIIQGVWVREPAIDILDVKRAGLRGTKDPALLELAAEQGRILITHDRNTMTQHFRERLAARKIVTRLVPRSQTAQRHRRHNRMAASCLDSIPSGEEWRDQIVYVPVR